MFIAFLGDDHIGLQIIYEFLDEPNEITVLVFTAFTVMPQSSNCVPCMKTYPARPDATAIDKTLSAAMIRWRFQPLLQSGKRAGAVKGVGGFLAGVGKRFHTPF